MPTAAFRRFLARWQGVEPGHRFEGPAGVLAAVEKLAGWEAAAPLWEGALLPARVEGYRKEWLDQLGLAGQVAWGRLWGSATPAVRSTPISIFPRAELGLWESLAGPAESEGLDWRGERVLEALTERGALFKADLERLPGMLPTDAERGLDELIGRGLVSSDSFAALRPLLVAPSRRKARPLMQSGRWERFRVLAHELPVDAEEIALLLLRRYGVVFRAVLQRERLGVHWRDLHRALRLMELRGDVHGGRFVQGYAGEQFALPAAMSTLRVAAAGSIGEAELPELDRADPLNLDAQLVPGAR